MLPWSYQSAGTLIFGQDSLAQLPMLYSRQRAKRVQIVTDRNLVRAGIAERVASAEPGIRVSIFDAITPEPGLEIIRDAITAARECQPDVIVGLGGGSNMDAAKLVAIILAHGGDPLDWVGDSKVPGPVHPLICIPTTAGTGSEVSAAAVFTDTTRKIKVSTLSPYLRPYAAIVDPTLTMSCPKQVSADSGIDAITHAIEAYTATDQDEFLRRPGGATVYQGKNPMADMNARECVRIAFRYLRRVVQDGTDYEAREQMALAATLGGLAFSNAGVALVHAMEYPVGGAVHVSHGAGNGLLLPWVMRYNLPVRESAFAELYDLLPNARPGTTAERAGWLIDEIEQLKQDIGIPQRLRDLGVTEAMLPGFAERAFGIQRLMRVNPRMPTGPDEILEVYRSAW